MARVTNRETLPADALTVRLTPRQRARLDKLKRMLDTTQSAVVNEALIHLLATLELRESVHRTVPSEQESEPPQEGR